MAAIVGMDSSPGLAIETHHRNPPNKSKLALYNPLLALVIKQLYISNKMECFSYSGEFGIPRLVKKSWLGLQINNIVLILI